MAVGSLGRENEWNKTHECAPDVVGRFRSNTTFVRIVAGRKTPLNMDQLRDHSHMDSRMHRRKSPLVP